MNMKPIRNLLLIIFLSPIILTGCATGPTAYEKGTTIAVFDLENVGQGQNPFGDVGEFLSAKVIETIGDIGFYSVVEREQLLLVLEELNLSSSSITDPGSRLELGRLTGAKLMLFGGYQTSGEMVRIDLRLVDTQTGGVVNSSEKTVSSGDFSLWLNAAQEATSALFIPGE